MSSSRVSKVSGGRATNSRRNRPVRVDSVPCSSQGSIVALTRAVASSVRPARIRAMAVAALTIQWSGCSLSSSSASASQKAGREESRGTINAQQSFSVGACEAGWSLNRSIRDWAVSSLNGQSMPSKLIPLKWTPLNRLQRYSLRSSPDCVSRPLVRIARYSDGSPCRSIAWHQLARVRDVEATVLSRLTRSLIPLEILASWINGARSERSPSVDSNSRVSQRRSAGESSFQAALTSELTVV